MLNAFVTSGGHIYNNVMTQNLCAKNHKQNYPRTACAFAFFPVTNAEINLKEKSLVGAPGFRAFSPWSLNTITWLRGDGPNGGNAWPRTCFPHAGWEVGWDIQIQTRTGI